ncbi:MAG: hypothetical protein ABL927_00175 [Bdellovibrionales bacterium]
MITVEQLAQCFLSIDPQKNSARLAFYHFLKNLLPLNAPFNHEMIDSFYDRALSMQYWQNNKNALGVSIKEDLLAIASRSDLNINLEQVIHSHEMQIIFLEYTRDFAALLAREIIKMEKNHETVKTFQLKPNKNGQPQEVMFVRLQKSKRVIVEVRQNIGFLCEGEVQLVRPHSRLIYTPELDFEPNVDQFLTTSLMRIARFTASGDEGQFLTGSFIQGTNFHRAESFARNLQDIPELFQAIKNVERFFVNPVTDPYYHQMMENFEKTFHEKDQQLQK